MARVVVLTLTALALVAVTACGGADEVTPAPETVIGDVPTETGGGGDVEGDPEAGKAVFASAGCGSCHVLSDAGTSGNVGPNLDDSSATFEAAVQQISAGGGGMPAYEGRLSDDEIANVAAYIVTARG